LVDSRLILRPGKSPLVLSERLKQIEKVDQLTDSEAVKLVERKSTTDIFKQDNLKSDLAPVHYAKRRTH
jgi:hypothetical protein